MPHIQRWLTCNRIKQSAGHRRWGASSSLPCLDELAGYAEQFGEESLAEAEPVAEFLDGSGVETGRVGDFDGFHRQLIGSAANAVAKLGQTLNEQIAQCFSSWFSHGNTVSFPASAGLRLAYCQLAAPHKCGR
jgi:hypothetical protein